MKYILYLSCMALVGVGCNSTVSRDDAERLITTTYSLPLKETREFYGARIMVSSIYPYSNTDQWVSMLGAGELYLVQKGIRSAEIVEESTVDGLVQQYKKVIRLAFTKGNPVDSGYLQDPQGLEHFNVLVATYSYAGINSLRKITDSEYEVEFSLQMTPNEPYFEAYKRGICTPTGMPRPVPFINRIELQNIKQRILKYDTGWGIAIDEKDALLKKLTVKTY